ncbi:hypothetical protein [Zhongshania sp.]|uniref:hypothetical protein n=1 Tax=Zhongshania sp. TaxID=1971902 RepID=UPI0035623ABC
MRFKVLAVFGVINLFFIVVALVEPISLAEHDYAWPHAAVLILIQGLVALAMLYVGRQKFAAADIADKTYPAVVVAYVLWLCMVWRWLAQ